MKKTRRVLEFSTYGPKAFASTKPLDPDLADRCVRVPMTRTLMRLPDLEGWEPIWSKLRDNLYRFTLGSFKEVKNAYQAIPGDGTRIGELWRPILTVLGVLGVEKEEVEAIHVLFLGAVEETRHELTSWETALFEALKAEAESSPETFEMTTEDILKAMGIEGDAKPGPKWVGDTLSRYNLIKKRLPRRTVAGKKVQPYLFQSAEIIKLFAIYMREPSQDDPSNTSTGENCSDTKEFHGREQNSGTRPGPSTTIQEEDGRERTRPEEVVRPGYEHENTPEIDDGRAGRENPEGAKGKIPSNLGIRNEENLEDELESPDDIGDGVSFEGELMQCGKCQNFTASAGTRRGGEAIVALVKSHGIKNPPNFLPMYILAYLSRTRIPSMPRRPEMRP